MDVVCILILWSVSELPFQPMRDENLILLVDYSSKAVIPKHFSNRVTPSEGFFMASLHALL